MTNMRWLLGATLSILAALSLSCGGGRGTVANAPQPATTQTGTSQQSNPLGSALPAPSTLIHPGARAAAGATQLCHNGAETDAALPVQNAAASGSALRFTPHWTAQQPVPAGLALALYRFTVAGYTGSTDLHLSWSGAGTASDRFVAVADFPRNQWNFLPVDDAGVVSLTADQFAAATAPSTLEFLAVTVVTGNQINQLGEIRIGANPGPFTITGVTPMTVQQYGNAIFTPIYTGDEPASWEWTFGGASLSGVYPGRMPFVYMNSKGVFNSKVTATDAHGVKTVYNFQLTVLPRDSFAPNLISVMPNAGETGTQTGLFAMADGGTPTSWNWNFGGGATPNTSTDEYPVITFGAPGSYDATATFTNLHGSSTQHFTLYVVPTGGALPPCIYQVGQSIDPIQPGMSVQLTAMNAGGDGTSFNWDFGGAVTPNTSTDASPTLLAATPGIYHGTVTVTNAIGTSSVAFTLAVVQPAAPHLTSVTINPGQTNIPLYLTPLGDGGGVVTYNWDFGGAANPNTSHEYIPQITPLKAGTYHASVTANNSAGSNTFPFDIVVTDPKAPHLTSISQTDLTTTIMAGIFAQNDGGPAASWSWNFGGANGAANTSTDAYSAVTPLQAGVYHGSVTATNMSGNSTLEFTFTVTDMAPPILTAVFPSMAVEGQPTMFFAQTTCGFPMTFTWDFGGGCTPNTSTDTEPSVTTGTPGTFNGTVTATNAGGSTTFPFTFTVVPQS